MGQQSTMRTILTKKKRNRQCDQAVINSNQFSILMRSVKIDGTKKQIDNKTILISLIKLRFTQKYLCMVCSMRSNKKTIFVQNFIYFFRIKFGIFHTQ